MNISNHVTDVLRRYEKSPLAQAQTALGKPEYVLWNVGTCPVPTFCEQLLPTQNFTGIGQSAKNDFQYRRRPPSWIFKIFILGHMTVIEFKICYCVPNVIKIE